MSYPNSGPSAGGGTGQINADVDVMATAAAQLADSRTRLDDVMTRLDQALRDAETVWQHDGAVKFDEVMVRWTTNSIKLTQALGELSEGVKTSGMSFEDSASQAAAMVSRASSLDGI